MHRLSNIFYEFVDGVGSAGSLESLKMHRFSNIFNDFLNEVGSPESLEIEDFLTFPSMGWEGWEAKKSWKYKDF